MSLKYINNIEYANEIEKLYLNSFPKEERFPFWILEECSKENNSDLYGIIDNDKLIGMCYLVNCSNAYYLMYLAVVPDLRNQNYGSKILMDLKEKYKVLFCGPCPDGWAYLVPREAARVVDPRGRGHADLQRCRTGGDGHICRP